MEKVMHRSLYLHSMGTLKCSRKLGLEYILADNSSRANIDTFFKLCVSSILHDYGKMFTYRELLETAKENRISLSKFEISCKPILHSLVGDVLAARDYNITDPQILKAIRCHTVGCLDMGIIDKILFVSDKIEQTRDYEGIEQLRRLSVQGLDRCLAEVYKNNIIYNIERNRLLHPDTSIIWNNICGGK
ncbi:MAG: bis(5'-nucleosyl)-tetraphosphatase (symmetrical) YqeK [Actinomycetota bacterium]